MANMFPQYTYNVYFRNTDKSLSRVVASKCFDWEDARDSVIDQLMKNNTYHSKLAVLAVINGGLNEVA